MALGFGPVFGYEAIARARRWQTYALRVFVMGALASAMTTIAVLETNVGSETPAQRYARMGEYFFYALMGVELALVMFAAPAATAGAICLDRLRGTLTHVLATDLSDREIVLDKLTARFFPVLALVASTWPVMALCTLLGGIDPLALALALAIIASVALLGCSLALALSVWARKPHEVILTTYVFWLVLLLAWPVWSAVSRGRIALFPGRWLLLLDPFYLAFAPYVAPGQLGIWEYALVFAAFFALSAALCGLAVWRMRPVALRMVGAPEKRADLGRIARLRRRIPGPSLDGNPVLWREWHRAPPSRWMICLVTFVGGLTGLACAVGAWDAWHSGVNSMGAPRPAQTAAVVGSALQVAFGLMMIAAIAPLSLSEERERGSLDLLSATPLSSWAIVGAKWWGVFRIVPFLALAPVIVGLAFATAHWANPAATWLGARELHGLGSRLSGAALIGVTILAHGAALFTFGLAAGTWIRRPARAIAVSLCVYILAVIALPILSMALADGPAAETLSVYTPVAAVGELTAQLCSAVTLSLLWPVGFGAVTAAALAGSLFWFIGRTFDRALGRGCAEPRATTTLADAVCAFGATSVAAGTYLATSIWAGGFYDDAPMRATPLIVSCYVLLVLLSLLSLAAVAARSISPAHFHARNVVAQSGAPAVRMSLMTEWWRCFRLAAFLAAGPGLVALAVATASHSEPGTAVVFQRPGPGGAHPVGAVPGAPRFTLSQQEMPLVDRLAVAAALVTLFLAHGAAITSMGLALATRIKKTSVASAAGLGAYLGAVAAFPLIFAGVGSVLFGVRTGAPTAVATSPISTAAHLGFLLLSRAPDREGFVAAVLVSNAVFAGLALGIAWFAIHAVHTPDDGSQPIH
jgi:ABC-type transport system involved in multi-copper enzyme maturation permease subunit